MSGIDLLLKIYKNSRILMKKRKTIIFFFSGELFAIRLRLTITDSQGVPNKIKIKIAEHATNPPVTFLK